MDKFTQAIAKLEKFAKPEYLEWWEAPKRLGILVPLMALAAADPAKKEASEARIEAMLRAIDPSGESRALDLEYLRGKMPPSPDKIVKRLSFREAIAKLEPALKAQENIENGWKADDLYDLAAKYIQVLDAPDNPNDRTFEAVDNRFESLGERINPDGKSDDLDPRKMLNYVGLI